MASIIIRNALLSDIDSCQQIEKSAAKRFLDSEDEPIRAVAGGELLGTEMLISSVNDELCFVSEINQQAVGFIAISAYANSWYIEELSVVEHAQRQGVGNALLAYIKMLAEIKRIPSINLITFNNVAWNQPYYARKGYIAMPVERLSEQFLTLWQQDAQHFDPELRVCMQLKIDIDKF
ncbi:MAG: GNAT family N-acetyltransferase [Rhizobiales bacterium]|nr:GNAT family N-acetyltransferase [Hyphomicrobiales bacterium]NRB15225.1 GNAT family N-acetyltransferase [Hyphomicrobiales bacterium]